MYGDESVMELKLDGYLLFRYMESVNVRTTQRAIIVKCVRIFTMTSHGGLPGGEEQMLANVSFFTP